MTGEAHSTKCSRQNGQRPAFPLARWIRCRPPRSGRGNRSPTRLNATSAPMTEACNHFFSPRICGFGCYVSYCSRSVSNTCCSPCVYVQLTLTLTLNVIPEHLVNYKLKAEGGKEYQIEQFDQKAKNMNAGKGRKKSQVDETAEARKAVRRLKEEAKQLRIEATRALRDEKNQKHPWRAQKQIRASQTKADET